MTQNNNVSIMSGGVVLTIAFFVAKILGYIQWSWLWIFAPIWIPYAIILSIALVCFGLGIIGWCLK